MVLTLPHTKLRYDAGMEKTGIYLVHLGAYFVRVSAYNVQFAAHFVRLSAHFDNFFPLWAGLGAFWV